MEHASDAGLARAIVRGGCSSAKPTKTVANSRQTVATWHRHAGSAYVAQKVQRCALFSLPVSGIGRTDQFDVTSDGQRFVILTPVETVTPDRAHVAVGWAEEVKAKQRQ